MKDTFFFPHDYNARNDPKMQLLLAHHGLAGVGLFWCLVEQLYEQGGTLPMDTYEGLAFVLHADVGVVESIVLASGLFKNNGEVFWSDAVRERLNKRADIAAKRKNAAMKRWGKPLDQLTVDNGQLTMTVAPEVKKSVVKKPVQAPVQVVKAAVQAVKKPVQVPVDQKPVEDAAIKAKESKGDTIIKPSATAGCAADLFSGDGGLTSAPVAVKVALKEEEEMSPAPVAVKEEKEQSPAPVAVKKKKETGAAKKDPVDFDRVVSLYHTYCPSFPRILRLGDARRRKIKARMAEMGNDWDMLAVVFQKMEESNFLRGDNNNGWQASFDWVFANDKNWTKILEGNYANRAKPASSDGKIDITLALQQSLIKKYGKIPDAMKATFAAPPVSSNGMIDITDAPPVSSDGMMDITDALQQSLKKKYGDAAFSLMDDPQLIIDKYSTVY